MNSHRRRESHKAFTVIYQRIGRRVSTSLNECLSRVAGTRPSYRVQTQENLMHVLSQAHRVSRSLSRGYNFPPLIVPLLLVRIITFVVLPSRILIPDFNR